MYKILLLDMILNDNEKGEKMRLIKVNFHSAVDVITNSSTTIFTYSGGTDEKAKELIDEFLKVLGSNQTADDMFFMGVFVDDFDLFFDDLEEDEIDDPDLKEAFKMGYSEQREWAEKQIQRILKGEIEEPDWMKEVEDREDYDGYTAQTTLYIYPKDKKYADLAEKIIGFLYSTQHDGTYNG